LFVIREQAGRGAKCPLDPFFIMPDKCHCVDFQVLKLQELPDHIPQGEMPRHLQLYCDRYLCDRVVPGNRVLILGIYSIKKVSKTSGKGTGREKALVGVRAPYIRVLGISVDGENTNIGTSVIQKQNIAKKYQLMIFIYFFFSLLLFTIQELNHLLHPRRKISSPV